MFARLRFLDMLYDLYESAFEDFFHKLMCARHPDFLDVRTHGRLGDMGSDGLSLHSRKLYACYAPQTPDASKVQAKFASDLAKAVTKREGEFDTFVFVHNDRRGVHPEVAGALAKAAVEHRSLRFEQMGSRRLWQECLGLDRLVVEDVLGCEIPIEGLVFGVGLEDLAPLLKHLQPLRTPADPLMDMPDVPETKLDFNNLHGYAREDLQRGRRHSHLVDAFYNGGMRELEHDEVARGFRLYYEQMRAQCNGPNEVLWQLEMYVMGNRHMPGHVQRAAHVVLAHFFERCDIFEAPPHDWRPDASLRATA